MVFCTFNPVYPVPPNSQVSMMLSNTGLGLTVVPGECDTASELPLAAAELEPSFVDAGSQGPRPCHFLWGQR